MKIIIDTNRIMTAIIRDKTTRAILFNEKFEFFMPERGINEILKHKPELCEKSRLSGDEFDILLSYILERVVVVPKLYFEKFIDEARNLIKDAGDFPFIALCMALKADGVWTEDKHFLNQGKVKVFRTSDMIRLM
jgi:predicted nucleic acid-binding protein